MTLRLPPLLFCTLLAGLLLSACATPAATPPKDIYFYTLDYPAPPPLAPPAQAAVLRVERFGAAPPFDTQSMIYADKGLHRNAYARYRWVAPPAELLTYLLARDLRTTQAFQAVLPPDTSAPATHVLSGWVEEFLEIDNPDAWQASLRLAITLFRNAPVDPSRRVLMQQSYRAVAPVGERTPAGVAAAMSAAAAQVSQKIVADLHRFTLNGRADKP